MYSSPLLELAAFPQPLSFTASEVASSPLLDLSAFCQALSLVLSGVTSSPLLELTAFPHPDPLPSAEHRDQLPLLELVALHPV